jgi:hypothetical protein
MSDILIVEFGKQQQKRHGSMKAWEAEIGTARLCLPPILNDEVRVHFRRYPADYGDRGRCRNGAGSGHCRILGHDRRDFVRECFSPCVLYGDSRVTAYRGEASEKVAAAWPRGYRVNPTRRQPSDNL